LLAVPNSAVDANEAESIIERVIDWARCLQPDSTVRLTQLSDTADILATLNCFPSHPNIEALLCMYKLEHVYSVDLVRKAINGLLDRARPLVDVLGCEAEAHSNCSTDPVLLGTYDDALKSSAERMLASIVGAAVLLRKDAGTICFAALGIPTSEHLSLQFRCEIGKMKPSPVLMQCYFPIGAFGQIALAWSYEALLTRLSPADVWEHASDGTGIHLAITLEALSILRSTNPAIGLNAVSKFAVGGDFFDSLERNNAGPNGRFADAVREACARLILGLPKYEVTDFLISRSGKKGKMRPLIRQDGAAGRRTHISKRHEALRLMVWECQARFIELANIGPKNELRMDSRVPERRIINSW
jgi:hypothetical protein